MSKAAVVILNYNGRKYLEQFLPGVLAHSPSWAEIIVADNASTDDSVDFLKKHFPQVRIIQNAENGGFAKGYNDALSHVDAEYFVLLNSDIEVPENWLEPCIALLEQHPEAAACQPKIRAFHQKDEFEYAGAAGGFIDKWGFPFCRGRIFDTYEKDNGQYNDDCEVFWATGACLVIRSSAWKAAEGFDADFFAHMEEIDLCWRLRNMGWKILYSGQSHIYHVGGGTLNKLSPRKTFLNFRNNLILIAKNHAPGWFFIKIFLRLCIDGMAGIRFLFSGDAEHCIAVLKAHFSFYASLGVTLKKRKALKTRISKWATGGVYNGSIVWDYFVGGKKKYSELDTTKFS
ncbi:MAG: glycosyltransferase family 2 protein [Bacteroidia bacterium]